MSATRSWRISEGLTHLLHPGVLDQLRQFISGIQMRQILPGQGRRQGVVDSPLPPRIYGGTPPPLARPLPTPVATNLTKIPYLKPLKHSNKTKLRLNDSKNNSLKIHFLIIKTDFNYNIRFYPTPPFYFQYQKFFHLPPLKDTSRKFFCDFPEIMCSPLYLANPYTLHTDRSKYTLKLKSENYQKRLFQYSMIFKLSKEIQHFCILIYLFPTIRIPIHICTLYNVYRYFIIYLKDSLLMI